MTVGETIQKYRKENGWSQEDLAEQVGVSRQSISLWEKDQTTPSLENMKILCHLFQISMDELLGQKPLPGSPEIPPPAAVVVTHWDDSLYKRAQRMLNHKYLSITFCIAVILTVLGVFFAVLEWSSEDNADADLGGYFIYAILAWGFWLFRWIGIHRAAKQNRNLRPHQRTTLEFYPGYIHLQSESDCSSSSTDWSYRSLKEVYSDGEVVALHGPDSMTAFYLHDLQGDVSWALAALKANAKKYSAPSWLQRSRLSTQHAPVTVLKGKKYSLWKGILIALFLASLLCFIVAMPVCSLLSKIGGLPEFTRYLWGFYLLLPIPIASILLGFWGMQQGIQATKNIIAGSIVAVLLAVYGSMGFLVGGTHSWDPQYYTQAKATAKLELPEAVSVDTVVFSPMSSVFSATALSSSAVTYTLEDGTNLADSLTQNSFWKNQLEESILDMLPGEYQEEWGPSLLYCVELNEYNIVPEEVGDYTFYYFTYDADRQRMLVVHLQMEISQQWLAYRERLSTD